MPGINLSISKFINFIFSAQEDNRGSERLSD
jgi:hypothetical protein